MAPGDLTSDGFTAYGLTRWSKWDRMHYLSHDYHECIRNPALVDCRERQFKGYYLEGLASWAWYRTVSEENSRRSRDEIFESRPLHFSNTGLLQKWNIAVPKPTHSVYARLELVVPRHTLAFLPGCSLDFPQHPKSRYRRWPIINLVKTVLPGIKTMDASVMRSTGGLDSRFT